MSEIQLRHIWFYAVMALVAIAAFAIIVRYGSRGHIWVYIVPIVVSPVSMWVIRRYMEYGKPEGMFDPATQSWAFLFGDWLLLPAALGVAAYGWRSPSVSSNHFFGSLWWIVAAIIFGLAVAYFWHTLLEVPAYTGRGDAELLGSPSKLWHDFVVYPALSAGIFYLVAPVALFQFRWLGVMALVPLLVWLVLGKTHDAHLDTRRLHPPVDETTLSRQ